VLEQAAALAGPFIIGLLVGILAKRLLSAALVLVALFIALAALGYTSPSQVATMLQQIGYAAKDAIAQAQWLKDTVPYSSAAFLIGLAIGLWKG